MLVTVLGAGKPLYGKGLKSVVEVRFIKINGEPFTRWWLYSRPVLANNLQYQERLLPEEMLKAEPDAELKRAWAARAEHLSHSACWLSETGAE